MEKGFYVSPRILAGVNFVIPLPVAIIYLRTNLDLWDYVLIAIGVVLTIIFLVSLVLAHKNKQMHMKPDDVDKLVTNGLYSVVRHPIYSSGILMNVAYLFFFRTLWLIPLICVFCVLWYLEARYEERVLVEKFGELYANYVKTTGMFFPKLFKPKEYVL